jgi:hypothetical protein
MRPPPHNELKLKLLSLSSLQQTIARQESRILWIKEVDAPATFFHAHANARCRCNHIRSLCHGDQVLSSEEDKVVAVFDLFNEVLAKSPSHLCHIKFEELGLPSLELSALGTRFTEEEVWLVIMGPEPDKAPDLDRFTARFFQAIRPMIRHDLMSAFDALWHLDTQHVHTMNDVLMVLLPKMAKVATVKDYRPITLIHSVDKLIMKALANRLAPRLGELVHVSQNAFIKGCFIHDSYKPMQARPGSCTPGKCLACFSKLILPVLLTQCSGPFFYELWKWRASPESGAIGSRRCSLPQAQGCCSTVHRVTMSVMRADSGKGTRCHRYSSS